MPKQHAQYEPVAWWWTRNQIGHDLRERYDVPKELPPEMLEPIRKLDVIEGRRYSGTPPDYEQMFEARTVAGVKGFPDWFVLT